MSERRRPLRRLGDVLPSVASDLGLEEQLRLARAMSSWERLIEERVPQAAGATSLIGVHAPALLVSATSAIVAQELRLRADELLGAFAAMPGGSRQLELRIQIRLPGSVARPLRDHGRRSGPGRVD
jgi:hypothetical protein